MPERALLIDFGGTLDADGLPWVDRFLAQYRHLGGTAPAEHFRAGFRASDAALAMIAGIEAFDYSETVAAQGTLLAAHLPDGDCLRDAGALEALTANAMHAALGNVATLQALRGEYRLVVVSNFQGNLIPCLDQLGLHGLFDALIDSHVVGFSKPDARIFAAALGAVHSTVDHAWMIGDSPPNDITGATALGMQTCWVAPASRPLPGITPTARASRFADVPDAIGAACTV